MLNKIIHFSLNNRLTVLVLGVVIVVAGLFALLGTEVDIFPDLNAPTVVVMTEAPGMAPEEVEQTVTFPIETSVNGATGVRRVRSSSSTGFSVVWIEFDWGMEQLEARQIVSERIANVANELPRTVGTPTLGPQSSILGEMLIVGLTSDTVPLLELRAIADRVIAPQLLAVKGVSQVSVIGSQEKEYQIKLSTERMRNMGVTLTQVLECLDGFNENIGGGIHYEYGNEYIVKGALSTSDLEQLSAAVVASDTDGVVTVGDIADVEIGGKNPRMGVASVRGVPSVLITVAKQSGAGTISLTKTLEEKLETIHRTLPAGIVVSTDIFRQSDFIGHSIDNLQRSLFEGAIFVVIVLFFFLMNLRTTLISVIALPLSIIVTVLALHWMGFTINTMSLGGIAIAIGSLVDDAIVDVENVYKRLRENYALPEGERKKMLDVVYHASAEVRMPIFNSSLIIIASFLPLFFLTGMEGRLLVPLGVAFIVALIASTIVALTVTPVLSSFLLGTKRAVKQFDKEPWVSRKLKSAYSKALSAMLGIKDGAFAGRNIIKPVLGVTLALFAVAVGLFFTLGRSFLPSFNEGSFTINVSTLPGISLDESDNIGRKAEELILSVPEIKTVARKTGRAELDEHSLGVNVSEIEAPYKLDGRTRGQVAKELREKLSQIPGANIEIGQPISHRIDAMLSGTEAQIAIKLFGKDLNQMYATGNQIRSQISSVPGVVDVNIEQQIERPQLDIKPRREVMASYGVTMPQFKAVAGAALSGTAVSKVYEDGRPYDITVILDDASRSSMESIADIMIDTRYGAVPLSTVAEIISTTGPNTINRENVERRLVISANVEGRDLHGVINDIKDKINDKIELPQNYYLQYGGQFESEQRASGTLLWTSLGALLVVFMLLYQEFHSVKQSLIVLVNMPLAMIGGVLILVITGGELNIPATIGFISLLGITTRNGMLLISRYNSLAEDGEVLALRVVHGSADRLLPIVMTALTSALALIPLAVNGHEPGNEIQSPLAIVILGGLLTSTVLNIFVVPALYLITCRKSAKQGK